MKQNDAYYGHKLFFSCVQKYKTYSVKDSNYFRKNILHEWMINIDEERE